MIYVHVTEKLSVEGRVEVRLRIGALKAKNQKHEPDNCVMES